MNGYTAEEVEKEYLKGLTLAGAYDVWFEDGGLDQGLYCRGCDTKHDPDCLAIDCWLFTVPKNPVCKSCDKNLITFAMGNGWSRYGDRDHSCISKCTSSKHYD